MKDLDPDTFSIIFVSAILIIVIGLLFLADDLKPQSIISTSYDNTLFVAFVKARSAYKIHDAAVLKALLMVQGNSAAKIKLAKMCNKFIEDEKLKDK